MDGLFHGNFPIKKDDLGEKPTIFGSTQVEKKKSPVTCACFFWGPAHLSETSFISINLKTSQTQPKPVALEVQVDHLKTEVFTKSTIFLVGIFFIIQNMRTINFS